MLIAALLGLAAQTASRVTLLDGRDGAALLRQCSRAAPAAAGFWRPSFEQVARAERAVAAALATRPRHPGDPGGSDIAALRRGWRVEAVGLAMRGTRSVYLNFVPSTLPRSGNTPSIICDGGPRFFGASIGLSGNRIETLDFNGAP